ncbi:hypothetical protein ACIRBX_26765 [Kitasatospora sp. NPDC096147]|uniref:hypothetical protein n=1 Tax=Kitasatospora sp. NPDC096147 TaxID=3364093 RepID=UPI0038043C50
MAAAHLAERHPGETADLVETVAEAVQAGAGVVHGMVAAVRKGAEVLLRLVFGD